MKAVKNITLGFLVSFIGSIPLGYLNIIGYEIYTLSGNPALLSYISGVVLIEAAVIYLTLVFAERIAAHPNIAKIIDVFTICFLIVLAIAFYLQPGIEGPTGLKTTLPPYSFFAIGIILSGLNFIQVPFWTGWNLYLVNNGLVWTAGLMKFAYLLGTIAGTFLGMLGLVIGIANLTATDFMPRILLGKLIPVFFVLLALYHSYKFYRKYYASAR